MAHCSKYVISEDKWTKLPDLNFKRCAHISFAFEKQFVYVCYGWHEKEMSNFERLDIFEDHWTKLPDIVNVLKPSIGNLFAYLDSGKVMIWGGYETIDTHQAKFNPTNFKLEKSNHKLHVPKLDARNLGNISL